MRVDWIFVIVVLMGTLLGSVVSTWASPEPLSQSEIAVNVLYSFLGAIFGALLFGRPISWKKRPEPFSINDCQVIDEQEAEIRENNRP